MTTLTVQPGTLQASMIDALGGPEPERALEQAFIQLARGGDLPLVLAMLKALVRVGLAGMAVRLLQSAAGLLSAEPQLTALAEQLADMPQGEVPRQVLASRLQSNLIQLLPTRPQLMPVADHWRDSIGNYCVFASNEGNTHVVRESPDTRRLDLVFPFADQVSQARTLKLPDVSLNSSYLLIGVPNPALFARLLGLKTSSGYQPPIDILEPDADVFGLWLHLIQNTKAFADERVSVFIGANAVQEYREFLINHAWRRPATHCTTNFRPRWTPPTLNGRFHESIATAINDRHGHAFQSLERRSVGRDAAYWADRIRKALKQGPSLRIAGFTTRYSTVIQHSMRDIAAAFQRRGQNFDIIMQPNSSCAHVDVVGALSKHDYDLIVVIDHLRSEFAGSIPPNVPYVCWIQDHMDALYTRDAGRSVTDLDIVIGHSPGLLTSAFGYPPHRFIASNNLTDPHTYSDELLPAHELEPHRCDVSYVGHGSSSPEELAGEIAAEAPATFHAMLRSFVQHARPQLEAQGWLSFAERMELALQAERACGHALQSPALRRRLLLPAIDRLFDRMVRHQALEWAARWATLRGRTLRIYGRGWERHPALGKFAAGEIANGRPLRAVYQASAASLQITGYSSLHQRLLDGLCCGALMLTRFNPFDFIRKPHAVITQTIAQHHVTSLPQLLELSAREPTLVHAINELHDLGHARIAPRNDSRRRREQELYREVFDSSAESLDDEGMFQTLAAGRFIPHRSACDLQGFESLTFKSEAQLHALLDRFVNDPEARRCSVQPMRDGVLANDTHDSLIDRVLEKFTST